MEQRVLTVELNGEEVVSKPFDFEAMCIIDDMRCNDDVGMIRQGFSAVPYLFEGSKVTNSILEGLPMQTKASLAKKAYSWYVEELNEAVKNG